MPFTAAHPAIVLPLLKRRRQWFSTTALIIGSMTPDSEYFLRLKALSLISHTSKGILEFDLPLTIVLAVLYHQLVRDQVIRHLPPYFRRRALAVTYPANYLTYLRRHWLAFLVSAVVGGFSHLFWDSFTFDRGFITAHVPFLQQYVTVRGMHMQLCRLIQHASTVVGLALLLLFIHRQPTVPLVGEQPQWLGFWLAIGLGGLLFLVGHALTLHHVGLKTGVVTLVSGWVLAVLFVSLFHKIRQPA